jgi:LPS-assembly lipoprotein
MRIPRIRDILNSGLWTLATLFLLSACGFQPVHSRATRAQLAAPLESVAIATDHSRLGQLLKAEIEDQVNPDSQSADKRFTMAIAISEVEISLFINPDGTSSRGNMQYNSSYTLLRRSDGKVIDRSTLTRISSYNISENADYGTYVSRADARKRGVLELAQDYKLRLINLLPKLNDPNAPEVQEKPAVVLPEIHPQGSYENRPSGI